MCNSYRSFGLQYADYALKSTQIMPYIFNIPETIRLQSLGEN